MSGSHQPVPAFLINLARRPDRLERVSRHLSERGVGFERLEACDGLSIEDAVLDRVTRASGPLGAVARGHRACTVSHVWAWQRLLDGDTSHAAILEDDIFVSSDFAALLQDCEWIPEGADLIKLEKYNPGPSRLLLGRCVGRTPTGRRLHPLRSRHGGTGAYLLSRAGAARMLAATGEIAIPVDHLLFNATVSGLCRALRPVIVNPGMATQYAVPYSSDTWTVGGTAKPRGWRRRWTSLGRGINEIRLLPRQAAEMLLGGARLRQVEFCERP